MSGRTMRAGTPATSAAPLTPAMPAAWVLLALLLVPGVALSGCLAGEPDPGLPVGQWRPVLPPGFGMAAATVHVDAPEHFKAVWDATTPLQAPTQRSTTSQAAPAAATRLVLPPHGDYAMRVTMNWGSSDDLDFMLHEGGDMICEGVTVQRPEVCMIPWIPSSAAGRNWTLEVHAFPANAFGAVVGDPPGGPDVPFRLTVDVRPTGPYGVPPPEGPEWEGS